MSAIAFLVFLFILMSCNFGNPKTEKIVLFPEIDISETHSHKELHIQAIAEIEYVPMETTDDFLLDGRAELFYVSDKYILVWQRQGDIFVFNRNGRAVFHFNHLGGGPAEYPDISNVIFDEKNEEIFVTTNNLRQFLVYSLTGEYRRTLEFPDEIRNAVTYNFDDETILVYDEIGFSNYDYKEYPYLLISKQDGSLLSVLELRLPLRYSSSILPQLDANRQPTGPPIMIATPNNRRFGEDFVIADISSDTIYILDKKRELTPWLVRKPSVHSSEIKTVLTSLLATNKFIFLWKIAFDIAAIQNNQNIYTSLMYEVKTGMTSRVLFINEDFPSQPFTIMVNNLDIAKNMTANLIDAVVLKEAYEERKLKGELEKLTETLDEEDNPVLMIIKFRQ
jgi:hypothetical protein